MAEVTIEKYLEAQKVISDYNKQLEKGRVNNLLNDNERTALCKIYQVLWIEAYYDPTNEKTQKFSKPLADIMGKLNKTLKFKE